jgi:hypothetical protein
MLRQFGALLTLAAAAAAAWRVDGTQDWRPPAAVAVAAALVTAVRPTALRWLFVAWMILAFPIGWLVGRLLLVIAFYGLFVPIGLTMRALGRDPLQRRPAKRATYWNARQPRPRDPSGYFRQY